MAFLAGLLTGSLAFWKPLAGEILEPAIQFMKSVPVASFVILALIWTGAENLSVFISFLVVYPVIHINTLAGLSHADPGLLEMARVFRVPVWRQALSIYRISLYPYLESALKTSLGMGFKSGIAAEVIGVPGGSIGEGLYMAKIYLSTADLFAWTLMIIAVSSVFEKLFLLLLKTIAGNGVPGKEENHAASVCPAFRITVRDLTKSYGDSLVLDHVSLDLESGCPCCLMAPSGAGRPRFSGPHGAGDR